jgi:hypothetical protein
MIHQQKYDTKYEGFLQMKRHIDEACEMLLLVFKTMSDAERFWREDNGRPFSSFVVERCRVSLVAWRNLVDAVQIHPMEGVQKRKGHAHHETLKGKNTPEMRSCCRG